jgi:hypothetical protein
MWLRFVKNFSNVLGGPEPVQVGGSSLFLGIECGGGGDKDGG